MADNGCGCSPLLSFSSSDSSSSSPVLVVLVAHLANLAVVVMVIRTTTIMPSWLFFKLNVIIWLPSTQCTQLCCHLCPSLSEAILN